MPISAKSILSLAGGVSIHMILGSLYIYGGISIYLASYYRQFDPTVTTRVLITFLPLRGLVTMFCLPLGAQLLRKYGPKVTTFLAGSAVVFSMFCLIFVKNQYLFVLLFAILFGVPTLNYMPAVMCGWKHFPNNKGTVVGIVFGGFALGPMVFTFLTKAVANPNNLHPTIIEKHGDVTDYFYGPEVANNVPRMFLTLFIVWSLMVVFTFFTLSEPDEVIPENPSPLVGVNPRECPTVGIGLRSFSFLIILSLLTISASIFIGIQLYSC